jgi:hypothetical protein
MLDLFDSGALCSLLVAAIVSILIGKALTDNHPKLRRAGALLAGITFLGSSGWALRQGALPMEWGVVALHAAALAGGALGFSWIGLAVLRGVFCEFIGALVSASSSRQSRQSSRTTPSLGQQQAIGKRSDETGPQSAVECERARKEADDRAQASVAAQRRRDDARVAAEVLFALHHHDIADRLPRPLFDEFLKNYMGENRDPDYVEKRSEQIQEVIRKLAERCSPPSPKTLQEIQVWYLEQKQAIEASSLDATAKKIQLIRLEKRNDELMKKTIQGD